MCAERVYQTRRGQETVDRVVKELEKLGLHVERQPETQFTPDLVASTLGFRFAVEVKGMRNCWKRRSDEHFRVSRLKLMASQWVDVVRFSNFNAAEPIVIVEIKTRCHRLPYLYRVLDVDTMAMLGKIYAKKWISASIWEIVEYGKSLKYISGSAR